MSESGNIIESAWATSWEDHAVFGVGWRAADGRTGAFAAGTEGDAEQIAREIVGTDPSTLEARYEERMQHAGEAARDYRRRKLLGLDSLQHLIREFSKRQP